MGVSEAEVIYAWMPESLKTLNVEDQVDSRRSVEELKERKSRIKASVLCLR